MEIDVSKCRFYLKDGSCSSMNENCAKCVHNYCDWKVNQEQLQQYKQLCEQKTVDNFDLIKENERLKELLSDKPIETVDIDSSFEIIKLRQCLDKIEEIVKCKCVDCDIDDYSYCPECRYEAIKDIRNKIKEVKGNE